jgi:hypothetical protein
MFLGFGLTDGVSVGVPESGIRSSNTGTKIFMALK